MRGLEVHEHLHQGEGLWEEYTSILLDPAHFFAELTFTLLDIVVLTPLFLLAWAFLKRSVAKAIHREHLKIDAEHGHAHAHGGVGHPHPEGHE